MLYFLLIIIAIGVLLASEAGQSLLGCFIWLGIIAVILFIGFWAVVLIWGFLSDKNARDGVSNIVGTILLIIVAIILIGGGLTVIYEKYKQGKLTKQAIKSKTAEIWKQYFSKQVIKTRIIENWKQRPLWVIFWIIALLAIIYLCMIGNVK